MVWVNKHGHTAAKSTSRRRTMNLRTSMAVLTLLAAPALAFADDMKMDTSKDGGAADKAFMDSMQMMTMNMDMKPTGHPDQDFVSMMLPHHQGADDMAKIELQYGRDPMLRRLATDIIKAQNKEIAMMKGWQAKNAK